MATPIKADTGLGKATTVTPTVEIAHGAAVAPGITTAGSVIQIVASYTPPGGTLTTSTTTCTTVADPALAASASSCEPVDLPAFTSVSITQVSAPTNLIADGTAITAVGCFGVGDPYCNGAVPAIFTDKGTPPVAHDDMATTAFNTSDDVDVLANDDPGSAGSATVTAVTQPAHGTAVIVPAVAEAAARSSARGAATPASYVRYTPDTGYIGADPFRYTISTPNGTSTATVIVTVAGPEPTTTTDTASTTGGRAVTIDVVGNDSSHGGGALTLVSVAKPAHGTARISGGSVVYTPDASFAGTETFAYTVRDAYGTATGSISVRVAAAPMTTSATTTSPTTSSPTTSSPTTSSPTTSSRSSTLASTGVPTEALVDAGLALLVAGGATTALGRRRRRVLGRHVG